MAVTSQPHGQTPGTHADDPGDVPAERPTSLDRLDVLIGQSELEATYEAGYFGPGSPAITGRGGRTTFEWLEGRFFLPADDPRADPPPRRHRGHRRETLSEAGQPGPHRRGAAGGRRGHGRAPQSPGRSAAGPGRPGPLGQCPARRLVPSVGDAGMGGVTDGGNTR